jgi:hypothetical protein
MATGSILARSKQAIPDLLDLTAHYTASLDSDWPGKPGLNLGALPKGLHAHAYSAFDIRGLIRLAGSAGDAGPVAVTLDVGLKGRKLHFLHGACGEAPEGTVIGVYTLNYDDGQTRTIPAVYGRTLRDLASTDLAPLTDAEIGAPAAFAPGRQVQLARYVANNPLPEVEIRSIDFRSELAGAAPFLVALTVERNDPVYEWFDSVGIYNRLVPRSAEATPDQVDLSDYYHASLDDDWFHHAGHDLHDVPKGLPEFCGVKFDVRGLIVLGGTGSLEITGLALPEQVPGIPVHRHGRAIHFLQACAFSSPPGTQVGEYRIHYANGALHCAPIIYSQNVMDWWENPAQGKVTAAQEAWFGANAATREIGRRTRLIMYTWANPLPEVEITAIDFVSSLANSAPFVVAITIEPNE